MRALGGALILTVAMIAPALAEDPPMRVGALSFATGDVQYALDPEQGDRTQLEWSPAELNGPVSQNMSLQTGPQARATIRIGPDWIELSADTVLDVLNLTDRSIEAMVRGGRVYLHLHNAVNGESAEVEMPNGSFWLLQNGGYDISAGGKDQPSRVVVFDGKARVIGGGGEEDVLAGHEALLDGTFPVKVTTGPIALPLPSGQGAAPQLASAEQRPAPQNPATSSAPNPTPSPGMNGQPPAKTEGTPPSAATPPAPTPTMPGNPPERPTAGAAAPPTTPPEGAAPSSPPSAPSAPPVQNAGSPALGDIPMPQQPPQAPGQQASSAEQPQPQLPPSPPPPPAAAPPASPPSSAEPPSANSQTAGPSNTSAGPSELPFDPQAVAKASGDEFLQWASSEPQAAPRSPSPNVSPQVTGNDELSSYGQWQTIEGYGPVWFPDPQPLPSDWAPYRYGHWAWVAPWGWTWIDDQPWGFAPFHYGRWAQFSNRWGWIPAIPSVRPVYAPALVAFVSLPGDDSAVGWVPLAPGEAYDPWYPVGAAYLALLNLGGGGGGGGGGNAAGGGSGGAAVGADHRDRLANRMAATVVPRDAFARGETAGRHKLAVAPDRLEHAAVLRGAQPHVTPVVNRTLAGPAGPRFEPHGGGGGAAGAPGPGRLGAPGPGRLGAPGPGRAGGPGPGRAGGPGHTEPHPAVAARSPVGHEPPSHQTQQPHSGYQQPHTAYQPHTTYQPRTAYQPRTSYQPRSVYQPRTVNQPINAFQPRTGFQARSPFQPGNAFRPGNAFQPHGSGGGGSFRAPTGGAKTAAPAKSQHH